VPPEVFLSGLASSLGERRPVEDLTAQIGAQLVRELRDDGVRAFLQSDDASWMLAARSARQTLDQVPGHEPDAVVYATDTNYEMPVSRLLAAFLAEVDLPRTRAVAVGGHSCGNFGPALQVAVDTIAAGQATNVLLVTADHADPGVRLLDNGLSVLSDGAASCLVHTREATADYALLDLSAQNDVGVYLATNDLRAKRELVHAVSRSTEATLAATGLRLDEFEAVLVNNYRRPSQRFLTLAVGDIRLGVPDEILAEIGHSFAADLLINLQLLQEGGRLADGERLLLLGTGGRSWSLVALQCTARAAA
jgi:3-oxoacyl-[acyl-carrier-protein] synthase-3